MLGEDARDEEGDDFSNGVAILGIALYLRPISRGMSRSTYFDLQPWLWTCLAEKMQHEVAQLLRGIDECQDVCIRRARLTLIPTASFLRIMSLLT